MNKEQCKRLGDVLEKSVANKEIAGGNLSVLYKGKEVFYAQAGYANLEEKKKIERNSIFRLYSMSKPVTSAAVMLLVERGEIDLLDPVSKFIPSFKNMTVASEKGEAAAWREITIADCMSMTSGLTYGGTCSAAERDVQKVFEDLKENMYTQHPMSTVDFAEKLSHCRLQFQPGESFQYGVSADLLGAIVEIASGMRFGEFLQREFFEPLGMADTGFWIPPEKSDRLTTVYQKTENGLLSYHENHLGICNHMDIEKIAFESGGAGLFSTIEDYKHFAQMLLQNGSYHGKTYLSPKTVAYMTSGKLLPHQQTALNWDNLVGFTYHNLMRILVEPSYAIINGSKGEYGWDGWLGPYFANLPQEEVTFLLMVQRVDAGTFDLTRKLRNVLATAL